MTTCLLITVFNRSGLLKNSLERLTHLTLPDEVLIVDDGSSDDCQSVVDSFKDRLPIKYIYNHNPVWSICSFARNVGIKNTNCDVVITSEPEILFVTDVIAQINKDMETHPDQLISAGVIYHAQQDTPFNPGLLTDPEIAIKDEIVENYQTEPRPYHPAGYCKTVNMQATFIAGYKREWLLKLGGWDEEFEGGWGWDDVDLCTRLRINGINQFIDSEIEAIHQWHEHLPPHIQGPASQMNERHMISKGLSKVEEEIFEQKRLGVYINPDERLIANKGKEWGVIHSR